jgi:hypothetical protein
LRGRADSRDARELHHERHQHDIAEPLHHISILAHLMHCSTILQGST